MLIVSYFATNTCFGVSEERVGISINFPDKVFAGQSFKMELTINKGNTHSFAKFQQELPIGMKATAGNTLNAQFSFKDQTIKMIWDKLPDTNIMVISYNIFVNPEMHGKIPIGGKLIYVENNEKHTTTLLNSVINIAQNKETEPKHPITSNINKNIVFRVQISASKEQLSLKKLANSYSMPDKIMEEIHNNMFKYTIGEFSNIIDAKTALDRIKNKNGINDAFLTAYEYNHRISINQAIKLTK